MQNHLKLATRAGSMALAMLLAGTFGAQAKDNGGSSQDACNQRALQHYREYIQYCASEDNGTDTEALYYRCVSDAGDSLRHDLEVCEEKAAALIRNRFEGLADKAANVFGSADDGGNGGGKGKGGVVRHPLSSKSFTFN